MSHHYRFKFSSKSRAKLNFKLQHVKLYFYRIGRRQASLWAQQGKEWVRWLMSRKEDLRGLAVTWKQPCGCTLPNRLYTSQCQTWSCWHTSWCWAMNISWERYDALCSLPHGGCMTISLKNHGCVITNRVQKEMLWSSEGSRSIKLKYDYKHLESISMCKNR